MKLPAPKDDPHDPLKNRRLLAFYSGIFALFWPLVVLSADVIFFLETGKVAAYLGYFGSLSGGTIGMYLWAAGKHDKQGGGV